MFRDAAAPLFDQPRPTTPPTAAPDRARSRRAARPVANGRRTSMQERYDAVVREMKSRYSIRINRWRTSTTGCAWEVHYRDGSMSRLIESPYPKGPMSAAVFLHEVGHHAIGFRRYKPRCLEEFKAWEWSINAMRERGLNVTPAVEKRIAESLEYAIAKAMRRGMKEVPKELEPFVTPRLRAAMSRRAASARSISQTRQPTKNGRLKSAADKKSRRNDPAKPRFRILWLFPVG